MQTKMKNKIIPTREEIQHRAYELWEKGGRQVDRDQEYWFQAETELRNLCQRDGHKAVVIRGPRRAMQPFGVESTPRPIL